MSTMTEKRSLLEVRAETGVDQRVLAEDAGLKQPTISRIENGVPVQRQTALQVFYALNRFRKLKGIPELQFDDIAWNLRER